MTATADLPLGLPFSVTPEWALGCELLAPLRAAVDRAVVEARAALDAMDEECKGTMAWDSCEDAIAHRELDWLYNTRAEVKENLWNAEGRHEGYDTWGRGALRKHCQDLARLLAAITHLIAVINLLSRREAEEVAAALCA